MNEVRLRLYEPATAPAIPRHQIGDATLSVDSWEMIGGVGKYAECRPMRYFRLVHRPPLGTVSACAAVAATADIETIICESVPIWRKGRYTFQWLAVVPNASDRKRLASSKGHWFA